MMARLTTLMIQLQVPLKAKCMPLAIPSKMEHPWDILTQGARTPNTQDPGETIIMGKWTI